MPSRNGVCDPLTSVKRITNGAQAAQNAIAPFSLSARVPSGAAGWISGCIWRQTLVDTQGAQTETCVFLKSEYTNDVTSKQVLSAVTRAARLNQFYVSEHAFDSHNATFFDIKCAFATATRAVYQPETDRWRIEGGRDDDSAELTVVVKFEGNLIIVVTAF